MKLKNTEIINGTKYVIFHHDLHIKLWNWLSKNPEKDKRDWPKWAKLNYDILNDCFACKASEEYCILYNEINNESWLIHCMWCPIYDYNIYDEPRPECLGGLYEDWEDSKGNNKLRTKLAQKIRDLTLKDGWEPIEKLSQ